MTDKQVTSARILLDALVEIANPNLAKDIHGIMAIANRAIMDATSEADNCDVIAAVADVSDKDAAFILTAGVGGLDGRSPWQWGRMVNGDLFMFCYPQGYTYEAVSGTAGV